MEAGNGYSSYLVRVWFYDVVGGEGEPPIWQGEVINIQSGQKVKFYKFEELSGIFKNR